MSKRYPEIYETGSRNALARVDPWTNIQPDSTTQTGGDWYRLLLATSIGKPILHGVNTAPSMEVLGRAPDIPDENKAVGFIRWDDRTTRSDLLGSRISDRFYGHHHYRGGLTKSGALLAFDEGSWEPSLRTRARASALLAAGIHAHGLTKADALETTNRITSDEVDPEAVDSTMLPAAHLKREMTLVSKPSHRVFSQGTIQKGILWDDTRLRIEGGSQHIAYDWGRITALARYIAESNVQLCPWFRRLAKAQGITYHISRNAWAEVLPSDYHLFPTQFANVPKIDLVSVGVPTIKTAFKDHELGVCGSLTRFFAEESGEATTDAFKGFTTLMKETRERASKRQKVKVATISEIAEPLAKEDTFTDRDIQKILGRTCSPIELLASAVRTRLASDKVFRTAVNGYQRATEEVELTAIDNLVKLVYGQTTWVLAGVAAKEAAANLEEEEMHGRGHDLLTLQLSRLRTELFGTRTHFDAPAVFTQESLDKLRPNLRSLLAKSRQAPEIKRVAAHDLVSNEVREIEHSLTYLGEEGNDILAKLRAGAKKRFKEAALFMARQEGPECLQLAANYMLTAFAIKSLGLRLCLARSAGYIDGSIPKESYLYRGIKRLNDALDTGKPALTFANHPNALSLADDIDNTSKLGFSARQAAMYVAEILDQVVGDLILGQVYQAPEDLYEAAVDFLPDPDSPKYDTAALDDESAMAELELLLGDAEARRAAKKADPYAAALASYKTKEQAEEYATLNGYKTFKEAYESLGYGAHYVDGSDFVLVAEAQISMAAAEEEVVEAPKAVKRGYEPMR